MRRIATSNASTTLRSLFCLVVLTAAGSVWAGESAPPPEVAASLAELDSSDLQRRVDALEKLGKMGPAAASAVPVLSSRLLRMVTTLSSGEPRGNRLSGPYCRALEGIAGEAALPTILEAVSTAQAYSAGGCLGPLLHVGASDPAAQRVMVGALGAMDNSGFMQELLVEAGAGSLPVLRAALESEWSVYPGLLVVKRLGAVAKPLEPLVQSLANEGSGVHKAEAKEALKAIRGQVK